MAGFDVDLWTNGGAGFRDLSRRLRQVEPSLRRKLARNIRTEGRPVLGDLKQAVRATPGGRKSRGTRRAISRNTKLQVRAAGIRFRTTPIGDDRRRLHLKLEGVEPWRKPLFGDREHWYPQSAHPWFYPTVAGRTEAFRRGVVRAIDEVLAELGG